MRFRQNPDPHEALVFCSENYLQNPEKTMLILIGDCSVDYKGRAESRIGWGERVVMIKQDGTVMVHTPEKREPVNWQPPKTRIGFEVSDGLFKVATRHKKPDERMTIYFRELALAVSVALVDREKITLVGMERDFVDRIVRDPSVIEEGLRIVKREKKTRSGSIDLYAKDRQGKPVLIEAKRSAAGMSAANQLIAYISDYREKNKEAEVRGILVAPKIQTKAKTILKKHGLEFREFDYTFALADDKQTMLTKWAEKKKRSTRKRK